MQIMQIAASAEAECMVECRNEPLCCVLHPVEYLSCFALHLGLCLHSGLEYVSVHKPAQLASSSNHAVGRRPTVQSPKLSYDGRSR